jgi:hypothetical protein
MDAATLKKLRPADASADSIEASIARMTEALVELRGELAALQGARRGLLLTGTTQDVDKHDARIRAVQIDAERISASIEALQPELAVARGKERLEAVEAMRIEAERAADVFGKWWTAEYEKHALAIAAGIELELAAHRARNEFIEAAAAASRDGDVTAAIAAGSEMNKEWPRTPLAYFSGSASGAPSRMVCLPAIRPGPPIFWPVGLQRAPIKTGEAAAYA